MISFFQLNAPQNDISDKCVSHTLCRIAALHTPTTSYNIVQKSTSYCLGLWSSTKTNQTDATWYNMMYIPDITVTYLSFIVHQTYWWPLSFTMARAEARAHRTAWPWAMAGVPLPLVPLVVAAMAPLAPCAPVEASIPCRQWPWDTPKISKNHFLKMGPVSTLTGKIWMGNIGKPHFSTMRFYQKFRRKPHGSF